MADPHSPEIGPDWQEPQDQLTELLQDLPTIQAPAHFGKTIMENVRDESVRAQIHWPLLMTYTLLFSGGLVLTARLSGLSSLQWRDLFPNADQGNSIGIFLGKWIFGLSEQLWSNDALKRHLGEALLPGLVSLALVFLTFLGLRTLFRRILTHPSKERR
jgi:hypothetical protein